MKDYSFILQSSPHLKDKDSVTKIMYTVIISLMPSVFASLYFFRLKAIALYVCCITACLATRNILLRAP